LLFMAVHQLPIESDYQLLLLNVELPIRA